MVTRSFITSMVKRMAMSKYSWFRPVHPSLSNNSQPKKPSSQLTKWEAYEDAATSAGDNLLHSRHDIDSSPF